MTLGELLPLAFSGRNLGAERARPEAREGWRRAFADLAPRVAVVLGSGLGAFADGVEDAVEIDYADIPDFPRPSVPGHAGRMVLGRCAGVPVAVLRGRVHLYEGGAAGRRCLRWLAALGDLGIDTLVLTNASGSLRPAIGPGSLVLVEDHINLQGLNPLAGLRGEEPRFVDMGAAYDPALRAILAEAARRIGLPLPTGVYLALLGPSFETPAEIRAFRMLGADLVGMSTVPETIAARALGLRVAAVSVVTNLAAGIGARAAQPRADPGRVRRRRRRPRRLLRAALPEIARAAT